MKKIVLKTMMCILVLSLFSSASLADTTSTEKIHVNRDNGTVTINVESENYKNVKVIIKKEQKKYSYNMYSSKIDLPLQMGSGLYDVGVYARVSGTKYRVLATKKFSIDLEDVSVFLQDVQDVSIKDSPDTVLKAKEITTIENEEISDMDKLEIVYDYVINNIKYDSEKASTVNSRYLPNVDQTLLSDAGICYDYSSLMAVMLRSLDIPTKLNKGYSTYTRNYHSWNEVYIDGQWLVIDASTDVSLISVGMENSMVKENYKYKAIYEF